ncbi:sigma-70 family RNA polymerase sigma factor [Psychroserpens sp. AS72]|uniref:RNA polymerase sigma factor n=1 Tax=Psychroserpens sp. AS72 TaxID=3135775 RepID=UPI00317346E7
MKSKKDKDLLLWAKLKDGNTEALGKLYDLYIDDLFSYGIQFSSNKTEVIDSIHDVFLNLYKYRTKLADTNHVKFYLLRSVKNQIFKKGRGKFQIESIEDNPLLLSDFSASVEEEIIVNEIKNERTYRLSKSINLLSKKQRQGLFLRFNEELDYEDIAKIMNVSVQTSRTIIYRAIKALRKNMLSIVYTVLQIFY